MSSEPAPHNSDDVEKSASASAPASVPAPQQSAPLEDLPEWEELTPELMEDECLRGDAMLRWSAALLAVLLGWTYLTETPVLVRIRTGELNLSRGGLPGPQDPFSASAGGRSWVNLAWLSDTMLGAVHQFLGMASLSVLCALTCGVAFFILSRITIPRVSTWWGSICTALAAVALFPVMQPGPDSVTILGLCVLLALLVRWQFSASGQAPWALPVLFLFWTNMDERAWLGAVVLICFAVAEQMRRSRAGEYVMLRKNAMIVGGALLVWALVSPWPGRPAFAFQTALITAAEAKAYGGLSEFFPRLCLGWASAEFWPALDPFAVAGLALAVIALATLMLNGRRIHWGWGAMWGVVNFLSLFFGDVANYSSIVNAVIATLNGQDFYRHRFSMDYAIDTWSVLIGRGGRTATVLAIFGVAYLVNNGALMGAAGRRVGFGLDPRWQQRVTSLETSVLPGAYEDKVFPTRPDQGDLLIWSGKKPFLDSRLALYRKGENLLAVHRAVRDSLFPSQAADAKAVGPEVWKASLAEYKVDNVFVRLWGSPAPYSPFFQLMTNRDWQMTGLGAAGALFTRNDLENESLLAHNEEHRATRFIQQAFRQKGAAGVVKLPATFPTPPSSYDQWLRQRLPISPASAELARHYTVIRTRLQGAASMQQSAALSYLAIRQCRQALLENPNDPLAYRVLAESFGFLSQVEQTAAVIGGSPSAPVMRSSQVLYGISQAALASGDDPADLLELFNVLFAQQKLDTALEVWNRLQVRTNGRIAREAGESGAQAVKELEQHIAQVKEAVEKARAQNQDRRVLVGTAVQGMCPSLAISILEEDQTELARQPELELFYASILLDVGRFEEAWQRLERLEQAMPRGDVPIEAAGIVTQWRTACGLANHVAGDVERAAQLWQQDQKMHLQNGAKALVQQPFASSQPEMQQDLWAALTTRATISARIQAMERWAEMQQHRGLAEAEAGRNQEATELFESLLETSPEFSQRAVTVFYANLLTGRSFDVSPPSDRIPVWGDMFAPNEPEPAEEASSPETPAEPMTEIQTPAAGTPAEEGAAEENSQSDEAEQVESNS